MSQLELPWEIKYIIVKTLGMVLADLYSDFTPGGGG